MRTISEGGIILIARDLTDRVRRVEAGKGASNPTPNAILNPNPDPDPDLALTLTLTLTLSLALTVTLSLTRRRRRRSALTWLATRCCIRRPYPNLDPNPDAGPGLTPTLSQTPALALTLT